MLSWGLIVYTLGASCLKFGGELSGYLSLDRGLDLKKSDITKRIQEVEDVGRRFQEQKENLEK